LLGVGYVTGTGSSHHHEHSVAWAYLLPVLRDRKDTSWCYSGYDHCRHAKCKPGYVEKTGCCVSSQDITLSYDVVKCHSLPFNTVSVMPIKNLVDWQKYIFLADLTQCFVYILQQHNYTIKRNSLHYEQHQTALYHGIWLQRIQTWGQRKVVGQM